MSKILIISSCSKTKALHHPDQPGWKDLKTKSLRKRQINKFKDILIPASELYIGPQARAITKAIKGLRNICKVDYYIVSAGFGFVHEDTLLPPYDATFSNKTKSEIREMASKLAIQDEMMRLPNSYDLIYIALGKDYMSAIGDLSVFRNLGKEIIHFDKSANIDDEKFQCINLSLLIGKDNIPSITENIGAFVKSKGSLLVNYSNWLNENKTFHPLGKYWNKVISELSNDDNYDKGDVKLIKPIIKYPSVHNSNLLHIMDRSKDYMASVETKKEIEKYISKYKKSQLIELAKSCRNISGFNPKKWENHEEYYQAFKELAPIYQRFRKQVLTDIDKIINKTGDSKAKTRDEYINQVRKLQEDFGIDKYLINTTKFAMMSTIVSIHENPKRVAELTEKRQKRQQKIELRKRIIRQVAIEFDIVSIKHKGSETVVKIEINNRKTIPIQDLKFKLLNEDEEPLKINRVSPSSISFSKPNEVSIPFVKAPMPGKTNETQLTVTIGQSKSISNNIIIDAQFDDTEIQTLFNERYQISIGQISN